MFDSNTNPIIAIQNIWTRLNILISSFNQWGIKTNEFKSSHVIFSLQSHDCPPITFDNSIIPHYSSIKHLSVILDGKLTRGSHLKDKRKMLNSRLRLVRPLLRSNVNISNKLFKNINLLHPIYIYIDLRRHVPTSSQKIKYPTIRAFQFICLHIIAMVPWYVTTFFSSMTFQPKSYKIQSLTSKKSFMRNSLRHQLPLSHNWWWCLKRDSAEIYW